MFVNITEVRRNAESLNKHAGTKAGDQPSKRTNKKQRTSTKVNRYMGFPTDLPLYPPRFLLEPFLRTL